MRIVHRLDVDVIIGFVELNLIFEDFSGVFFEVSSQKEAERPRQRSLSSYRLGASFLSKSTDGSLVLSPLSRACR